jgi:presenilin-like A22 family membrane protease
MSCFLRVVAAFGAAIMVFCVTFYVVWIAYGDYLIKKNPHHTMAGLMSAAYGIEAGLAAAIVTFLLVLFVGRRRRDLHQSLADSGKDRPHSR